MYISDSERRHPPYAKKCSDTKGGAFTYLPYPSETDFGKHMGACSCHSSLDDYGAEIYTSMVSTVLLWMESLITLVKCFCT